jgi:rod shape-determining protein MreB
VELLRCFEAGFRPLKFGNRFSRELVFDIGSSNTVVISNRKPFLVRIPSQVAAENGHATPGAGREPSAGSRKQTEQADPGTQFVAPVVHGRVNDAFATEQLLKALMRKTDGRWSALALRTTGALIVPPFLGEEETSRMRALLVDVGFSRVHLVQAPFAAAMGCGLVLSPPEGQMLMDFGGGKVSFAVFSLGELAAWWQDDFGSQELDGAIVAYVLQRYSRRISRQAAEKVKLSIGSVFPKRRPEAVEVTAVDTRTEDPKRLLLEDSEIRDVLIDGCERLILAFQRGFENVAPELSGDVARKGITLVGRAALLEGLPEFLRERTGLQFRLAPDPATATAWGAQGLLRNGGNGTVRV